MVKAVNPNFERLRTVAANLFWAQGYAATTTRGLASAMGMKKASLYNYINSKEDLLYWLCIDSLQNIHLAVEEAVVSHENPTQRVKALIGAHVSAMLEDKNKHAVMLTEMRSLTSERRHEVIGLRDDYENLIRSILAEAQKDGGLRTDLSAKYLELSLLNLMNWAIFWFRPNQEMSPEQLSETFATLFLEGAQAVRTDVKLAHDDSSL